MSTDVVPVMVALLMATYLLLLFWRQVVVLVLVVLAVVFLYGLVELFTRVSRR